MKAITAGTTSTVGLIGASVPKCARSLTRTMGSPQSSLPADGVQASALFPPAKTTASDVRKSFTEDKSAYVIHCVESVDELGRTEFWDLETLTCSDQANSWIRQVLRSVKHREPADACPSLATRATTTLQSGRDFRVCAVGD